MKKIILAASIAALAFGLPGAASAQRNRNNNNNGASGLGALVVVIDTDRIYRECAACVAAQTQLQSQITALQQRAAQLGQPLQTEMQSIEQAAQTARSQTGAARTAAETALQARVQALRTRENTANQELGRGEQTLRSTQSNVLQQINAQLNPLIGEVMRSKGANLAVDTGATLAHAPALNVTNDVLALLNQRLPSVQVVPLPATAAPAAPAGTTPPPATPQPSGR